MIIEYKVNKEIKVQLFMDFGGNIFGFTFNVTRQQVTIQKGQTVVIEEWSWKKFRPVSKAITMDDDGNIKVTYLD